MIKNRSRSVSVKRSVYYFCIALVLAAVAGFLAVSNWRILGKTLESIKYRQAAEANLKVISERESGLTAKLNDLETDTGLDKEIRKRFPVAKPGEEVIMIVTGNNDEATSESNVGSGGGWWQKFFNWF